MTSLNLAASANQFDTTDDENFLKWYTDMIENYPNVFVHYLTEDALLHWFGRSIRGTDRILHFIKLHMSGAKHIMHPVPNIVCESNTTHLNNRNNPLTLADSLSNRSTNTNHNSQEAYACDNWEEMPTFDGEIGQGDCKFSEYDQAPNHCETFGIIEIIQSYYKCGALSTSKWKRPCTLKIGYEGSLAEPLKFNIQFMIYDDKNTCKKNLLFEFEDCENDID